MTGMAATITPQPSSSQQDLGSSVLRERTSIGRSVQGRDLSLLAWGSGNDVAIVVVGNIQGDQSLTRSLVHAIDGQYQEYSDSFPRPVALYLIPSINPDGAAVDSRYNAQGVDLNRNWDTRDWTSKASTPDYPDGKVGLGGTQPFSEPETRALRTFLLDLKSRTDRLYVIILHSSVHRSTGEVYPASDRSLGIARTYADTAGYNVQYSWDQYVTSGEAITWCDEQDILALDIVVPARDFSAITAGNPSLVEITLQALRSLAEDR
jgi:hypothetical protein